MVNFLRPDFDNIRDQPGFRARRARLGRQAGSRTLGASLWEVEPGQTSYPYHFHLTEEEMLVVLSGRPSLRTPEGWRDLEEGDVVPFLPGEGGAHQLVNRTEEPVRFLSLSAGGGPQVAVYPDADKVGIYGSGKWYGLFRRSDTVEYYEGESPAE